MDELKHVFQVLPENRVVICRCCRFAVPLTQIQKHLARRQQQLAKRIRRSVVSSIGADAQIARTARDIICPKPQDRPIEGLPIYYSGLRCTGSDERGLQCLYVCRTVRGIQDHCQRRHDWTNEQQRGGDASKREKHSPYKM